MRHRWGSRGAVVVAVALAAVLCSLPVAGAETPEAAAEGLLDAVDAGDLAALDALVCPSERERVRQLFDVETGLGIKVEAGGAETEAFDLELRDRAVEVVEQTDERASVRVSGTLTIGFDPAHARDLVRGMLATEGQEVTDADLDLMVPLITAALAEGQLLDERLEVVLEGGQWLVCGGLDAGAPAEAGPSPAVSFAGLCGIVSLADVNAAGPEWLTFDSNDGREGSCSYSRTAGDGAPSLTMIFGRGERLETYQASLSDGETLTLAGLPALAAGDRLLVGLEEGVLTLVVQVGEEAPADFDARAYLAAVGELVVPALIEEIAASGT